MTEKFNCLISGISGFIGSHLAECLLEKGYSVYGIDNLSTGRVENMDGFLDRIQFIEGNVLNIEEYTFTEGNLPIGSFDVLYHLAATPRVQYSVEHPVETNRNNVEGTLQVLEWARKQGVKRVVFASSSSVYGGMVGELMEGLPPRPKSPYALQKLVGEEYCRIYSEMWGMDTVSLRFFNVYGTRMNPRGDYACLIPRHIRFAKKNYNLPVYGFGQQTRSFTYVGDIVEGLTLAGESGREFKGEVINLGYPESWSVNEVDKIIVKLTGSKSKIEYLPRRKGDPAMSFADADKARRLLGWEPKIPLEEGIKKIVDYY